MLHFEYQQAVHVASYFTYMFMHTCLCLVFLSLAAIFMLGHIKVAHAVSLCCCVDVSLTLV